ncbi:MAG: OmpA family protein [Micropruina glycogenica]
MAWALIGPKPAAAETTRPDPSTSPVVAEALALPIEGEVRDLAFPTANLDGSVTEEGTVITLKADVFFAYNKATLNSKASAALDRAAARLKELGATTVRVAGYTDSKGTAAYNRGLSLRRAEAVRAGLATRLPDLTQAVKGYGESRPVASNETAKGRALNRRVTIAVTR